MGFRGRIVYLSQLIADSITGAQIIGGTITGALFRTAATGKRWEISSAQFNRIKGYSGQAGELIYGQLAVDVDTTHARTMVYLAPPSFFNADGGPNPDATSDPSLWLMQNYSGSGSGEIQAFADKHTWQVITTADAASGGGPDRGTLVLDSTGLKLSGVPVLLGADSGWLKVNNTVGFANGWTDFDARVASYRKIGNRVYLRGLIKSGTMSAAAFLLPAAYRPVNRINTGDYWLATSSSAGYGALVIDTSNGGVVPSAGSNAWVALDGISWLTD